MGEDPTKMGENPTKMGENPTKMGEDPTKMGENPTKMGEDPTKMGEDPTKIMVSHALTIKNLWFDRIFSEQPGQKNRGNTKKIGGSSSPRMVLFSTSKTREKGGGDTTNKAHDFQD